MLSQADKTHIVPKNMADQVAFACPVVKTTKFNQLIYQNYIQLRKLNVISKVILW